MMSFLFFFFSLFSSERGSCLSRVSNVITTKPSNANEAWEDRAVMLAAVRLRVRLKMGE